jgi:hypothetical protein
MRFRRTRQRIVIIILSDTRIMRMVAITIRTRSTRLGW